MLLWKLARTAAGVMNVERTGTGIPMWVLCPTSLPQFPHHAEKDGAASRKLSRAIRRPVFCITLLSAAFRARVAKLEVRKVNRENTEALATACALTAASGPETVHRARDRSSRGPNVHLPA